MKQAAEENGKGFSPTSEAVRAADKLCDPVVREM